NNLDNHAARIVVKMAAAIDCLVELRSVRRMIGRQEIIPGLSLSVHRGEFLTVLGPSGSGKTTTLNLIAGFDQPDAGVIEIDGRDVSDIPAYARGIGMVFQNYALFPHLTVADNVAFPLRMRERPEAEIGVL